MAGHVKKPKTKTPELSEAANDAGIPTPERILVTATRDFDFDSVALSIVKTTEGYSILSVELDSKTLTAGKVTVLDTAGHKQEAVEKFKINVVKNGII